MLEKNHNIELIINGEALELYDPAKLNLRMNNVLFKPEEITSKTGEYSFSFDVPATKKNNRIFNFANNMSKLNKFNTLYDCEVNVDGISIFTGTLRLSNSSESKYTCNLISMKINKVEDIFGDSMMNELVWKMDFAGTDTINEINSDENSPVYFPLACYGAFQKEPYTTYNNDVKMYTDLLNIDKYNLWYWESFHPSFNLVELIRKMFAQKGYTLGGDILNDHVLRNIYLSEYIDGQQDPVYNLNRDSIGKLNVQGRFLATKYGTTRVGQSIISDNTAICRSLEYPKVEIITDEYDYAKAFVFDIFGTPCSKTDSTATHYQPVCTNDYIYRKNRAETTGIIQIPATGLYTIELTCGIDLLKCYSDTGYTYKYDKPKSNGAARAPEIEYDEITISDSDKKTFDWMPVEIQLLRNTDEPELIWTAERYGQTEGYTQYPHETKDNALMDAPVITTVTENTGGRGDRGESSRWAGSEVPGNRFYVDKGTTVAFDPKVCEGFLCGFTTANKSCSVLKNGKSWDPTVTGFYQTHYRQAGYKKAVWNGSGYNTELTEHNLNTLNCPNTDYWSQNASTANGKVTCVVELNKNDILYLKVITKGLENFQTVNERGHVTKTDWGTYNPEISYDLTITPYSPDIDRFLKATDMNYLPSQEIKEAGWGEKLNLGNFLNSKEKMSDFVSNFLKTFNLQYNQIGNSVFIDKNKLDMVAQRNAVNIDNRVLTAEANAERIDYPHSMEIKFAISDEEAGAYRSIDTVEHQGANNWKDYIDRGSDKVEMDTTNESTDSTVESRFSYNWYQDFTYYDYNRQTFEENGNTVNLSLPLIAKDEDFIIQSDDAMKHDGLSLRQRMWFRQPVIEGLTFEMWNHDEEVDITVPTDEYYGVTLNFKNEQGSLLDRYFNIQPRTDSNYLNVSCYLTPTEYLMLKNGAFVEFDSDLYIVSEIEGFDPTGSNKTELRLIKKV